MCGLVLTRWIWLEGSTPSALAKGCVANSDVLEELLDPAAWASIQMSSTPTLEYHAEMLPEGFEGTCETISGTWNPDHASGLFLLLIARLDSEDVASDAVTSLLGQEWHGDGSIAVSAHSRDSPAAFFELQRGCLIVSGATTREPGTDLTSATDIRDLALAPEVDALLQRAEDLACGKRADA